MKNKKKWHESTILEESILAMAQATISQAIDQAGIDKTELARRMGCSKWWINKILKDDHHMRTFARALEACGYKVRFTPCQDRRIM